MKKKTKILMIVMLIIIAFNIASCIFINTRPMLAVREYEYDSKVYDYLAVYDTRTTKTLGELKTDCEKLVGEKIYIYIGTDHKLLNGKASGYCMPLLRTIVVNEKQSKAGYVWTLAHELVHLKYCNTNETWVNFETFKILYESENELFVNVAKRVASNYLMYGYENKEYDISGYVIDYLKEVI